jgi:hypothetical protein
MEALAAMVRSLATAEVLPGPFDYQVAIPPVQTAWCRRVPGYNVWLFYRVREDVLYLLHVVSSPPVPLD